MKTAVGRRKRELKRDEMREFKEGSKKERKRKETEKRGKGKDKGKSK